MKKLLLLCSLTVFLLSFCNKPKACIQVNKSTAAVNEEIQFTSCSKNTHHVDWDFGDGSSMIGDEVTHTYSQPGKYTISMTAHFYEDRKQADHSSTSVTIQ